VFALILLSDCQSKFDGLFDFQFVSLFAGFGQTFFVGCRVQFGKIRFAEKAFGGFGSKAERFGGDSRSENYDGDLRLVGLEYVRFAPSTAPAPTLFGHEFHYDSRLGAYTLHVWAWRNNPSGTFAPFNPKLSCPAS